MLPKAKITLALLAGLIVRVCSVLNDNMLTIKTIVVYITQELWMKWFKERQKRTLTSKAYATLRKRPRIMTAMALRKFTIQKPTYRECQRRRKMRFSALISHY